MMVIKVSGDSARLGQFFLLVSLFPLELLFSYFMFDKLTLTSFIVLLINYGIAFLIFKNAFSNYDVYRVGDELVFKNLFFRYKKLRCEVKKIENGFLPISFSILFKDGSEFCFHSSIFDLYKGSDNMLFTIKEKILKNFDEK